MGGSMSSSSLFRSVALVEIITSLVIASFGANTLLLFQQENDEFQKQKEMIFYSSIVAIVQSVFTILSSVFLVGCQQSPPPRILSDPEQGDPPLIKTQVIPQNSFRRRVVAPTWMSLELITIASLLFTFIAPIHYCIQGESDIKMLSILTFKDGTYETLDGRKLGLCYSEDEGVLPIRNSLRDLYSFTFIGVLFKVLFVLMVYQNWKKDQKRAKKVLIFVERCDSRVKEQPESFGVDPKIVVSGCSTSSTGGAKPVN